MVEFGSEYFKTLGAVAGVLSMKLVLIHLFMARSGLAGAGKRFNEDGDFFLRGLLKAFFLSWGPFTSLDARNRLDGATRNVLENEPMFLLTALMWGATCSLPAFAPTLLKIYMVLRCFQLLSQFLALQPFRALSWFTSAVIQLYMAVMLITTHAKYLEPSSGDMKLFRMEL